MLRMGLGLSGRAVGAVTPPTPTVPVDQIDVATDLATADAWHEVDLTGITTATVSSHNATFAGAGAANIEVQLSADGGSTWYTTSGNYVRNTELDTSSTATAETVIRVLNGTTLYGATHYWELTLDYLQVAAPKLFRGTEFLSDPGAGSTDGAMLAHFFGATVAINRMRIRASQNGTSGTIYVTKETRPQTLLATIAASTLSAGDITSISGGCSSALIISNDYNPTSSVSALLRLTSGATVYNGSTDYKRAAEVGTTSAISVDAGEVFIDSDTGEPKRFAFEIRNMNVAAPTHTYSCNFVGGTNTTKWWGILRNTATIDGVEWFRSSTAGTIYVIGDTTPVEVVATLTSTELASGAATFSVGGYKRLYVSAHDAVADANAFPGLYLSADGGSSYDETAGDYWRKREKGNDESQGSDRLLPLGSKFLDTANQFIAGDVYNLDVPAPAFSRAVDFATGVKQQGIHLNPARQNHVKLVLSENLSTAATAALTSGTIYVTGEANPSE